MGYKEEFLPRESDQALEQADKGSGGVPTPAEMPSQSFPPD